MTIVNKELVEIAVSSYMAAWEESFKTDNPFHTLICDAEDKKHIENGMRAVIGVLEQHYTNINSDLKARLELMTTERDKLARIVEELEFARTKLPSSTTSHYAEMETVGFMSPKQLECIEDPAAVSVVKVAPVVTDAISVADEPDTRQIGVGAFSRAMAIESIGQLGVYDISSGVHNGVTVDALVQYARTVAYKVFHNLKHGHPMLPQDDPLTVDGIPAATAWAANYATTQARH